MSTDRELLELAAKAAGITVCANENDVVLGFVDTARRTLWNPLTDDGDELRLIRALGMVVEFLPDAVRCKTPNGAWVGETCLTCDSDALDIAHRRAIVRAAAEIGKAMP